MEQINSNIEPTNSNWRRGAFIGAVAGIIYIVFCLYLLPIITNFLVFAGVFGSFLQTPYQNISLLSFLSFLSGQSILSLFLQVSLLIIVSLVFNYLFNKNLSKIKIIGLIIIVLILVITVRYYLYSSSSSVSTESSQYLFSSDFITYRQALQANNSALCDKLSNIDLINHCKGIVMKDSSLCTSETEGVNYGSPPWGEFISSADIKNDCLARATKNISLCKYIVGKSGLTFSLDDCFNDIALELGDVSECANARESESCYVLFASAKGDPSICENIMVSSKSFYNQGNCYTKVASAMGDLSICEKIVASPGDYYTQNECYKTVASDKGDSSICEKIVESSERNDCYLIVAYMTEDSSICEKIVESSDRDSCYESYKYIVYG